MNKPALFIAATGQNVGKTTLCLGIQSALRRQFSSVGFIKPVGQQHITCSTGHRVDKDAYLFKKIFDLPESYAQLSPVIFPSGFTRSYIDGEVSTTHLRDQILHSFLSIRDRHPITVVEGTGHVGVGSLLELNNADVAALLGVNVVIIASGGLGSAYDELALNISMCRAKGAAVKGVILNRVIDSKRAMIIDYFERALKQLDLPLLGCIPFCDQLSHPTMENYTQLFKTDLLSGHSHAFQQYPHSRLIAGSLESFLKDRRADELIITPACRLDILEAIYDPSSKERCGVILSGRAPPTERVLKLIRESDIPTLYAPLCSYDVMKAITSFVAKIGPGDVEKVKHIVQLVENHLNIESLMEIGCASV